MEEVPIEEALAGNTSHIDGGPSNFEDISDIDIENKESGIESSGLPARGTTDSMGADDADADAYDNMQMFQPLDEDQIMQRGDKRDRSGNGIDAARPKRVR